MVTLIEVFGLMKYPIGASVPRRKGIAPHSVRSATASYLPQLLPDHPVIGCRRVDRLTRHSRSGGQGRGRNNRATGPPGKEESVAGRGDDVRTIAQGQRGGIHTGTDRSFGDRVGLTIIGGFGLKPVESDLA